MVEQLEKRPDATWRTGTIWSFKVGAWVLGHGGAACCKARRQRRPRRTPGVRRSSTLPPSSRGFPTHPMPQQYELKVYGWPGLDAVWGVATGRPLPEGVAPDPLPAVLAELRSAEVPPRVQAGGGGTKARAAKKK